MNRFAIFSRFAIDRHFRELFAKRPRGLSGKSVNSQPEVFDFPSAFDRLFASLTFGNFTTLCFFTLGLLLATERLDRLVKSTLSWGEIETTRKDPACQQRRDLSNLDFSIFKRSSRLRPSRLPF